MASRHPESGAQLARESLLADVEAHAAAPHPTAPTRTDALPAASAQPAAGSAPAQPRLSRSFKGSIATLLILLLVAAALVVLDRKQTWIVARHMDAASSARMLSQRIDAGAQRALLGEREAFVRLQETRSEFEAVLGLLMNGSERAGVRVPAAGAQQQPALQEVAQHWKNIERNVAVILAARERLLAPPSTVASATPNGEIAGTAAADSASAVRQAARDVAVASDALLQATNRLEASFGGGPGESASRLILGAAVCAALALACLLFMGKVILDDAERRAVQSQEEAIVKSAAHERTQNAILRLLDEMGNLAQGDLTVRASVSEEVTGAIADAVNYAVDELRRVVVDIDRAAVEVASASSQAQAITGELLNAAQRQAQEIAETNVAVASVAQSIVQVSQRAADSARVADLSLGAAAQGAGAVKRAIQGMDSIREQIQDTAKRIKRLGESSQEIGEIVDLISDITEQTNVLALNAAIQATSAGPAGRGFSLVAEEVQRLAERSAQATRQISAIVKTIQADTQDATSAMERSTQGVVEQTGLADATSQALARIDEVSRRLAGLIGAISAATREQTDAADRIRANMMDIQRITELTTEGTRKTADATARLARLALELKQSVTGFRLS